MNGAKLTAADTVIDSPTVNLLLNESLRVMAGGLIQGKWINISAGDIEVEASGNIDAEKRGYAARSGPGISSGIDQLLLSMFIQCYPLACRGAFKSFPPICIRRLICLTFVSFTSSLLLLQKKVHLWFLFFIFHLAASPVVLVLLQLLLHPLAFINSFII